MPPPPSKELPDLHGTDIGLTQGQTTCFDEALGDDMSYSSIFGGRHRRSEPTVIVGTSYWLTNELLYPHPPHTANAASTVHPLEADRGAGGARDDVDDYHGAGSSDSFDGGDDTDAPPPATRAPGAARHRRYKGCPVAGCGSKDHRERHVVIHTNKCHVQGCPDGNPTFAGRGGIGPHLLARHNGGDADSCRWQGCGKAQNQSRGHLSLHLRIHNYRLGAAAGAALAGVPSPEASDDGVKDGGGKEEVVTR